MTAASVLRQWLAWLKKHEYTIHDLSTLQTGQAIMRRHAIHLRERTQAKAGIAASTVNTYFADIRACLTWAVRNGRLHKNPAFPEHASDELPDTKTKSTHQQRWGQCNEHPDTESLEKDSYGPDSERSLRNTALVTLLYYAALRGVEILRTSKDDRLGRNGLRWSQVNLEDWSVEILGKDEQDWVLQPLPDPEASSSGSSAESSTSTETVIQGMNKGNPGSVLLIERVFEDV